MIAQVIVSLLFVSVYVACYIFITIVRSCFPGVGSWQLPVHCLQPRLHCRSRRPDVRNPGARHVRGDRGHGVNASQSGSLQRPGGLLPYVNYGKGGLVLQHTRLLSMLVKG